MEFFRGIWRILCLARPKPTIVVTALVCTAVASIFQMLGLGLVIPVLNGLVDPNHYEALLKMSWVATATSIIPFELNNKSIFSLLIALVLLAIYLENIFLFLGQKYSAKINMSICHRLRVQSFERFLSFSKGFYDRANLGELNLLLTSLITQVGQAFHDASQLIITLSFSMAFFGMMLVISWRLTLCAVILLPITNAISKLISKRIQRASTDEVNHFVALSDRSLDVLTNIELTQIANQESAELERFSDISEQIRLNGYHSRAIRFAAPRIVDMINSTGIIILVGIAVFLFIKVEASSIGRLSIFFISLRRFTSHIEQLTAIWGRCIAGIPPLDRVAWIFDNSDKTTIESGERICPGVAHRVAFNDVCFSYENGTQVLHDISFSATKGTMTALVGPTGAGKTTLVNLLARFYDCTTGSIEFDGVDIRKFELGSLRSTLAFVSQDSMLFQDTVRNNLTYGLAENTYDDNKIIEALEKAHIFDFVMALPQQLSTKLGGEGIRLSGGERQRLSIARAILRDPDILILDEATSALDAETERDIQEALDELVRDRTVFVIAHRLSTIRKADQIIVIEAGRISERGSSRDLLDARGKFYDYCELQRMFV